MSSTFRSKAKACCSVEKERVSREVARCDSASSADYRHRCYRSVARKSGERSRNCMISS
jgi:hypothetical protein